MAYLQRRNNARPLVTVSMITASIKCGTITPDIPEYVHPREDQLVW